MTMIAALNSEFGIENRLSLKEGGGGFPKVVVQHPAAAAEIYLHGAHLTHFQPAGQNPVIFMSSAVEFRPGKAIRGGIPVIWPWFGPHQSDMSQPQHGLARKRSWSLVETAVGKDGRVQVKLSLENEPETASMWSDPFRLEILFQIGRTLTIDLVTYNLAKHSVEITQALHTYFEVSDIRQALVHGFDGKKYLDKPSNHAEMAQEGPIRFDGEVDRVYLDAAGVARIKDPGWERTIEVRSTAASSNSTIVWNPWIEKAAAMGDLGDEDYLRMVCVETANAASDVRTIPAGGTHTLTAEITIAE